MQAKIEEIIEKHKGKKAFLRASGTENVLRLHVEAETQEQVKAITAEIRELVAKDTILNWVIINLKHSLIFKYEADLDESYMEQIII